MTSMALVTSCNENEYIGLPYKPCNIETLRKHIICTKAFYTCTWDQVAGMFHISKGLAWKIAVEGYDPKDDEIRKILNLEIYAPAPVCPTCGIVHVSRSCPVKRTSREKTPAEKQAAVLNRIKRAMEDAAKLGLEVEWTLRL